MLKQIEPVYLLDTNTIRAVDMGDTAIMAKVKQIPRDRMFISIVTVAEVLQGWLSLINKHQGRGRTDICAAYDDLDEARVDLNAYHVIRYSPQAESVFQTFSNPVKRVGTNDCRIAATAIAHGLIVVTRNVRDFSRIPNVKFEDWTI